MSFKQHNMWTVKWYGDEGSAPIGQRTFKTRDGAMALYLTIKFDAELAETVPLPRIFEESHEVVTQEIKLDWSYV